MNMDNINEQIKKVELNEAEQENEYIKLWNKETEDGKSMLDHIISTGFARRAEYSNSGNGNWRKLKRLRQCRRRLKGRKSKRFGR